MRNHLKIEDQFMKRVGRDIALGRAIQAIERQGPSNKIPNDPMENRIRLRRQCFEYLSEYQVQLTELERGLFRRACLEHAWEGEPGFETCVLCGKSKMRVTIGCACRICGRVEENSPAGSLPDGWVEKTFEEGSCFFCSDCREQPICRVCGCTNGQAWVEADLCSACAGKDA